MSTEPEGFAERLLAVWEEGQNIFLEPAAFAAWSGATKDLLIDMGLEWDTEEDRYVLDAGVAKRRRDAAKAVVLTGGGEAKP